MIQMSITVTLEEAQAHLAELLRKLSPGDEIIIKGDRGVIAKVRGEPDIPRSRPKPGLGKGGILRMSDDFDKPISEMADYME